MRKRGKIIEKTDPGIVAEVKSEGGERENQIRK
jgi:hypothetical protein